MITVVVACLWGSLHGAEEVVWDAPAPAHRASNVQTLTIAARAEIPPPPPPPLLVPLHKLKPAIPTTSTEPKVTVVLVGQVIVDLFFRIEYFRHVLLGKFPDVTFEIVSASQGTQKAIATIWENTRASQKEGGGGDSLTSKNDDGVVLLAMLRDDADAILLPSRAAGVGAGATNRERAGQQPQARGMPTWLKHVGILHIDDEKLDAGHRFAPHVGFTLRNYYHADRVSPAVERTYFVPVGWRTTDGTFWDPDTGKLNTHHPDALNPAYLNNPTEHASVQTKDAARKASDRPLGFFFAGQIRKGGREDMERAIKAIGARIKPTKHRPPEPAPFQKQSSSGTPNRTSSHAAHDHSSESPICGVGGLAEHGIAGCSDVFIAAKRFLSNGLSVDK